MRYSRRYRESESDEVQIDISPLIDIVFILVIFFVVTTVFNKEAGVDVAKPPKVATTKALQSDSVMLALTESGEVYYGGQQIGFDGIESVVVAVQDGGDPVPVVLICDRNANAENITKIINAATLANAKSVSIATQK